MKKSLTVIAVLVCATGVAWARYATFQQASDAANGAYVAGNLSDARSAALEAVSLAAVANEQIWAQHFAADRAFELKQWKYAVSDYCKVLAIDNLSSSIEKGEKFWAFDKLKSLSVILKDEPEPYNVWTELINAIGDANTWMDYFYRAKAKEMLKDWTGAKADYDGAWALRPENAEQKKLIIQALKDVELRLAE